MSDLAELLAALAGISPRVGALEATIVRLTEAVESLRPLLPPLLFTVPEAARALKVSIPTMRRWIRTGQVPSLKIENSIRVDLSRIRATDDLDVTRLARAARNGPPSGVAIVGSHK